MRPPRFSIKTMLIAVTVIAVWLSTLTGYQGSRDVLAFIWTASIVMSGIAAATLRGSGRAFWAGFCGAMVLLSTRATFSTSGMKLNWTSMTAMRLADWLYGSPSGGGGQNAMNMNLIRGQIVPNIQTTFILITLLASATAIGLLSVFVYQQCRTTETSASTKPE